VSEPELHERSRRDLSMLAEVLDEAFENRHRTLQVPFDLLLVESGLQEFAGGLLADRRRGERQQHRQRDE